MGVAVWSFSINQMKDGVSTILNDHVALKGRIRKTLLLVRIVTFLFFVVFGFCRTCWKRRSDNTRTCPTWWRRSRRRSTGSSARLDGRRKRSPRCVCACVLCVRFCLFVLPFCLFFSAHACLFFSCDFFLFLLTYCSIFLGSRAIFLFCTMYDDRFVSSVISCFSCELLLLGDSGRLNTTLSIQGDCL